MNESKTYQYHLNLGKTKKLIEAYQSAHNSNNPLSKKIRGNQMLVMNRIVYYMYKHVNKQCEIGNLQEGKNIPELRTNSVQISKAVGCSKKTVYNSINRLIEAGLILSKTFHGSNSSFGLSLNTKILHISRAGEPSNEAFKFSNTYTPVGEQVSDTAPDSGVFSSPKMKSLPHTVTSTLLELNNKLIRRQNDVDNITVKANPKENIVRQNPNGEHKNSLEPITGNTTSKLKQKQTKNTPPVAPAPPKIAFDTVDEALSCLSSEKQLKIRPWVKIIWDIAEKRLYSDYYLVDREVERGKARICEYLMYSPTKNWSNGTKEIIDRIGMVCDWQKKQKMRGEKVWKAPIPSVYFDIRSQKGFVATKKWFIKRRNKRIDINNKTIVTKCVNKYISSLKNNAPISPAETYRQICQFLGKKNQKLLTMFNERIALQNEQ